MEMQAASQQRKGHQPQRTCAGCGKADERDNLVRLVVDPQGEIAVDLAGGAFGRGAHLHPSAACIEKAARKGLARAFEGVRCEPAALGSLLVDAAERRLQGLLSSAIRSGAAVIGFEAVDTALGRDELGATVVAHDAGSCAQARSIQQAVAQGRAVSWGSKAALGALVRRDEVAVLGIRNAKIAAAVLSTCRVADSARSVSEVR
jgi:predicted RNA-binding protein YlxR (DUF448 family)